MNTSDIKYRCNCGFYYKVDDRSGSHLRCPSCGRIISLPSKEMARSRQEEFDKFIDAVFELLGQDSEEVCPFSGAR